MENGNVVDQNHIDELRKNKTLKKQYAYLLFKHQVNNNVSNQGNISAFKAAEELIKEIFPFQPPNETNITLYLANTWPNDEIIFEYFMVMKEAEAKGEFYPNKAQVITHVMNRIDMIDDEIRELGCYKKSKKYEKLKQLRESVLETSKLLHDLMGWNF